MTQLTDLRLETEGVIARLDELSALLSTRRTEETQARIAHEKAKESMAKVHRDRIIELSPDLAGTVDPKTGKSNKEYTEMVMHRALEQDVDYVRELQNLWETQEAQALAQTASVNVADELGVTRTKARLLAALLEFAHGDI